MPDLVCHANEEVEERLQMIEETEFQKARYPISFKPYFPTILFIDSGPPDRSSSHRAKSSFSPFTNMMRMPGTPKIPKKSRKRKGGRLGNEGTTTTPSSVEDISLEEATPSVEATLPAKSAITTENPISKPTEDTSKSQPVEVVWPTFKHPCRVRSGTVPLESDPMFRRTLGERIKITVGSGNGSGGGGHRQQQHQQNSPEIPRPTTKVFFLHKRLLCEHSDHFGAALSPRNRDVFVEANTGHFVFDEPDELHRWAKWLYVCSGCNLYPVFEFQYEHRFRPSRLESG
ncbi:hypothetical protein B0T20DRAFT_26858 [Sordaria brevicollis]|uniref:BTB domain-containing protein n=1 Tax=Sordaria brevicollis TaxID=83679 RepID=A0AAE0PNW0_SORBR|nr:hypothetical protein B0T20DRAFT_26858 [Sordaria brevicollis]